MGISSLRRNNEKRARVRLPTHITYAEHTQVVQELTQKYEREILALKGGAKPKAKPKSEKKADKDK